jgi:hypothetical protein
MHHPAGFTIDRDCSFWTNNSAYRTARAAILHQFSGMVAARSDAVDGQGYYMLRAGRGAQLTALAIGLIYNNPSFWGHQLSPNWIEIIR